MKTKAIVGNDFVDTDGVRHFSFQICAHRNGRFETIANLNVRYGQDGIPWSSYCHIESFKHSRRAVDRLASIYMRRSIPVRFTAPARTVEIGQFVNHGELGAVRSVWRGTGEPIVGIPATGEAL